MIVEWAADRASPLAVVLAQCQCQERSQPLGAQQAAPPQGDACGFEVSSQGGGSTALSWANMERLAVEEGRLPHRNAMQPLTLPTPPASGGGAGGIGGDRVAPSGLLQKPCAICTTAPADRRSKYCNSHKRAYECIYRQACKGKEKATPEWKRWCQIFGGECGSERFDPDPAAQVQVLVDFAAKFPSQGSKKRGCLELSQYASSVGARDESSKKRRAPMLDFEIFMSKVPQKSTRTAPTPD